MKTPPNQTSHRGRVVEACALLLGQEERGGTAQNMQGMHAPDLGSPQLAHAADIRGVHVGTATATGPKALGGDTQPPGQPGAGPLGSGHCRIKP